jgi:hypothetical protein
MSSKSFLGVHTCYTPTEKCSEASKRIFGTTSCVTLDSENPNSRINEYGTQRRQMVNSGSAFGIFINK